MRVIQAGLGSVIMSSRSDKDTCSCSCLLCVFLGVERKEYCGVKLEMITMAIRKEDKDCKTNARDCDILEILR